MPYRIAINVDPSGEKWTILGREYQTVEEADDEIKRTFWEASDPKTIACRIIDEDGGEVIPF